MGCAFTALSRSKDHLPPPHRNNDCGAHMTRGVQLSAHIEPDHVGDRLTPVRRSGPTALLVCAAAGLLAGCTGCEEFDDAAAWRAVVITPAEAAVDALASGLSVEPDCSVEGAKLPADAGAPGATADPNLLEVARLEIERDCYKKAEQELRRRIEGGRAPASDLK